jgi:hypothetical protein
MLPKFTFYVQAGKEIGLGHLIRSNNIIQHLIQENFDITMMMEPDDFIAPILSELGTKLCRVKQGSGPLIIDAINFSNISDDIILSYYPRILISPVFDKFELITHFITRNLEPHLANDIPSNVKTEIDPLLSFTTVKDLIKKKLDFKEIDLGICISGSNDYVNLEKLLRVIARIDNVKSIKMIGQGLKADFQVDDIDFKFSNFEKTPWKYFQNINVFIGGEGIMLSEALYQNIPAISMCRKKFKGKNKNLISIGLLTIIDLSQRWENSLLLVLGNKELLEGQYKKLMKLKIPNSTPLMIKKIKKIIFN